MLVHKGGKIKNWVGECRDVTPTKSLSQNIRVDVNREVKFLWKLFFFFLGGGVRSGGGRGWGSQGGCEQRIEVFVKIKKKKLAGSGWGGGGSEWMWTKNWSFCENSKKKKLRWGREGEGSSLGGQGGCDRRIEKFLGKFTKKILGGGGGRFGGGQGGCEWRIEVFVQIQKKKKMGGGGVRGWVGGGSGWMRTKNWSFCENSKKKKFFFGGGGQGERSGGLGEGSGWGVRVDVNEELKFLWKFQKKIIFFWGGGGAGVGWGWGSGWMWIKNWSFFENSKKNKGGGRVGPWGGPGWGVRMNVNEELKFLLKSKKKTKIFFFWGGWGGGVGFGGQGGCKRRIEVFVKIQKENYFGGGVGGRGRVGGSEWMWTMNWSFFEN